MRRQVSEGERRTFRVEGCEVHGLAWRGAPDTTGFLVLPGLGGSCVDWGPTAKRLARESGREVVVVDLPGFGRSRLPDGRASVERFASVVEGLLEQTGRRVLVGSSMGGLVALLAARSRPELVEGLVLVDPALPSGRRDARAALAGVRWALTVAPVVGPRLVDARKRLAGVERHVARRLSANLHRPEQVDPALREAMVELARERLAFREAARCYSGAARSIVSCWRRGFTAAAQVPVPALVVHGRDDRVVPVSVVERLQGVRPDWAYEIVEECGHLPHVECPEDLVEAVVSWLPTVSADAQEANRAGGTATPSSASSDRFTSRPLP